MLKEKEENQPLSYEQQLTEEYNKAKENGFSGTKEEYMNLRDFT